MPFEKGHKHGGKSMMFVGALKRAIAQDDGKRLREAAEQLLTQAAAGEPWAIGMLADRLDGKAQQHINVESTNVSELSLVAIAQEIAGIVGGGEPPAQGADEHSGLH